MEDLKKKDMVKEHHEILSWWGNKRAEIDTEEKQLQEGYKATIEVDEEAYEVQMEGFEKMMFVFFTDGEYSEEVEGIWGESAAPPKVQAFVDKYIKIWSDAREDFVKHMKEKGYEEIPFDEFDENQWWCSEWKRGKWFLRIPWFPHGCDSLDLWDEVDSNFLRMKLARRRDTEKRWEGLKEVNTDGSEN